MKQLDSRSVQTDCKPLLDACSPLVYRNNAFRITGLPADASTRDIKRRIDDLKAAEEMGDGADEHYHAFALDPTPSLDDIREAARRLQDPERRLIEEFFWFWPMEWGKGKSDLALSALEKGDKETAIQFWSHAQSEGDQSESVVATHNIAVMYQLVALDWEHIALERDLTADELATIEDYWRATIKRWDDLLQDEVFWSLLTDRIRMLDDPRLTTGFARRLRQGLPEAMDKINAMLAIEFVERNKLDLAGQHIAYMKESHEGLDDVPKTLAAVSQPLRTRIKAAIERANSIAETTPQSAEQAALDLVTSVAEPIRILEMLLSSDDHQCGDLCDSVASACLKCATAYVRATDEWHPNLDLIEEAERFARSAEAKSELARAKEHATELKELSHPKVREVVNILQRIESLDPFARIKELYKTMPSLLSAVADSCGKASKAYEFCANAVAINLRNIAVDLHNCVNDSTTPSVGIKIFGLCLELHDRATSLACDQELKAKLREDETALSEFRRALDARGARDNLRNELVREGVLPTWGNSISASKRSSSSGCLATVVVAGIIGLIVYAIAQSGSSNRSGYSPPSARSPSYTPSSPPRLSQPSAPLSSRIPPSRPTFNEPAKALPSNGWTQRYHTTEAIAPLEIVTRGAGQHYFVKIEDYYSKRVVATVFIRGGLTADLNVPIGSYRLKYASGGTWYGTEHLFGPSTSYSKADERFNFTKLGNQVSGYTVELYLQTDGNLATSTISASEF